VRLIPTTLTAVVLAAGLSSSALADKVRCTMIPADQWLSIEKAIGKAESLGYSVRQAKRSKGCWKVEGYDRNGAKIEVHLHPGSGDVIKSAGWHTPVR
jgi:hypothetical protein